MTKIFTRSLLAGALVASTGLLAGCGSGAATTPAAPGSSAGSTGGSSSSVSSNLPAAIASSGTLRVGTNVPFVPMEYLQGDGTTMTGIDIDLMTAVAQKLGLKAQFINAAWDGLIPSLNAGRYDVLAASFGDFLDREKQVDMVDMLRGGIAGIARVADAARFVDESSLCGKSVAVEKGSATVQVAAKANTDCTAAGKAAVTTQEFPTDAAAVVALQSGRVDLVLDDRVVAQHLASTNSGKYAAVLTDIASPFSYGFVVKKSDPALTQAVTAALNALIADGTYARITGKYGISGDSLLTRATVNQGTARAG